jgi:hypothetical protein
MFPDWVRRDVDLARDEDLRRLQLRWARDDLWMRRISFAIAMVALATCLVLSVIQPFKVISSGWSAITLAALPVAYFLRRQSRR